MQTNNSTWSFNGHTYQLVKELKTWDAANTYAKSSGGYLVKVDSSAENQSILNEVRSRFTAADYGITYADDGGSASYVWLGASDAVSEGQWFWSKDNSTLSKVLGAANTFWGNGPGHAKLGQAGEPDNFTQLSFPKGQDYLAMGIEAWPYYDYSSQGGPSAGSLGTAGQWNDVAGYRDSGNSGLYFVIEFDASQPTISFAATTGSLNEGNSGNQTVTVTANLSSATTTAVTLPITYSGTATSGTDYTNAPTSITIAAGATTGTASFSVVGDTTVESNETVVLTMGTPTGATLGANTTYTHTITNDDVVIPTISFAATTGSANEGNSGNQTVNVTANLSSATTIAVTLPITYSGTATSGTDYTNAATSITILAGVSSGTASFSVVGDTVVESNETVVLTMGTPTGATLGANTTYTHTITNDDVAQSDTISPTAESWSYQISPAENFTIQFSESIIRGNGLIKLFQVDKDYNEIGSEIQITDSISSKTLTIDPQISLNPLSTYKTVFSPESILDLSGNDFVGKNSRHAFIFNVLADTTAPLLASSSPVDSATAVELGAEFVLSFNETVKAGSGSFVVKNGATTVATIAATDTTQVSFNGSNVTINPTANLTYGTSYTITAAAGVIKDSAGNSWAGTGANPYDFTTVAPPTISFNTSAGSANEGNSGNQTVNVIANLSSAATTIITVPITYSGTATSGTDYTNAATAITILAGASSGTTSFSVVGDTVVESNETVVLTMGTPTGATLGANKTYTHIITNEDFAPTYQVSSLQTSVNEGSGVTFTVATTNVANGTSLTYSLSGSGITAADVASGTLTGSTTVNNNQATFTLNLVADQTTEGVETLIANIQGQSASVTVNDTSKDGNRNLSGDSSNNSLKGASGNDTLDGGMGIDTLTGGAGDDVYYVDNLKDVVVELVSDHTPSQEPFSMGNNNDVVVVAASASGYVLKQGVDVEDMMAAGIYTGNDPDAAINMTGNELAQGLIGNSANNLLKGMGGDDDLVGMDGNDTLWGGDGKDLLAGGKGNDSLMGEAGDDLFLFHFTFPAGGTDLLGRSINVDASGGYDTADGGAGTDTVLMSGVLADYTISRASATQYRIRSNDGTETMLFTGVEKLVFGDFAYLSGNSSNGQTYNLSDIFINSTEEADWLSPSGNENWSMDGRGGNDTLNGGTGNDTLYGGAGSDKLYGGKGDDWLTGFTYYGDADGGGDGDGDFTQAQLDYEKEYSADSLYGGAGNDFYVFDQNVNTPTVIEIFKQGIDSILGDLRNYVMPANVENYVNDGCFTDGNSTPQTITITGNSSNNLIKTSPQSWDSAATILNTTSTTFDSQELFRGMGGNDTLISGFGNDSLYGDSGNDRLDGGAGDDHLDGGSGFDVMLGGRGNDTYWVDSSKDVVTEGADEGNDVVYASVSYTLGANIENLFFQGSSSAASGSGGSRSTPVKGFTGTGNELNNRIEGSAGADVLKGGEGNDSLHGGIGSDTLTGGSGEDVFIFSTPPVKSNGYDRITDFTVGQDKIQLETANMFKAFQGQDSLMPGDFISGNSTAHTNEYLIYNKATGGLYYDDDGSGSQAAVQIALIANRADLQASDIWLI